MHGRIIKRKRAKSSWTVVISLDRDYDTGKRKQKWIAIKGPKRNAEKVLTDLMNQYNTTGFIDTTRTTFQELLDRWLPILKTSIKRRPYERYAQIIRQHIIPDIGNIQLSQLRAEHIQRHYSNLLTKGYSPSTVKYHQAVIHKALEMGIKWGLLYNNVSNSVELPKKHHVEFGYWDKNELNDFLSASKDIRFYALFHTALFTGMRRSELFGLQWDDIDLLGAQISVRRNLQRYKDNTWGYESIKSKYGQRNIAIFPSNLAVLRQIKRHGDLVFCNDDGSPLHPNTVTNAWQTACKRAGVKVIRFHDTRHTHATLLLKQGIHPKVVQERLGHSTIQMTLDIYSHVVPGLQEAAARRFEELITQPVLDL